MSDDLSKHICESCNSRLSEFIDFQNELVENQIQLYSLIVDNSNEDLHLEIQQPSSEHFCYVEKNDKTEDHPHEDNYYFEAIADDEESANHIQETLEISIQGNSSNISTPKVTRSSMKTCQDCGLDMPGGSWHRHLQRFHIDRIRFVCDNCDKGFRFKRDLAEHMKCHMNVESREKFPCFHCDSKFLSLCSLKNHFHTFHSAVVEEHHCDVCAKIFRSRLKLNQHILVVHNKGTFDCEVCSKSFRVKYNLQKHTRKEHGEKEKCSVCGKFVAKGRHMREHMLQHEPPKFECNFAGCGKKFQGKKALQYHLETQHQALKKSFECTLCSTSSFNSLRNLNRHISRQHNKIKIACEIEGCDHTSSRKDYLASHYKNHKDIDQKIREKLLEKVKTMKDLPW